MGKRKTTTLLSKLFGRAAIIGVSILVQCLFYLMLILYLSNEAFIINYALQLLSTGVVLYLMNKKDNPSYKIPWIILTLSLPLVGGITYLSLGNKHIPKKLRKKVNLHLEQVAEFKQNIKIANALPADYNENLQIQSKYITESAFFPAWTNTSSEFYPLGEDMFPALISELKKAKKFILMEYYIIDEGLMWNSILNVLKERVADGVDVYLMYDDMGTITTLPAGYKKYLQSLGINVTIFNPFKPHVNMAMNYRDHRKITVIDGNVGFCGGVNLADEYINEVYKYGHWKDTAVKLVGEAVVNLTGLFTSLWNFSSLDITLNLEDLTPTMSSVSDGYVQPFGDNPFDDEATGQSVYLNMINRATDYLYIDTPYLITDNETMTALCLAAKSGIDVRIITPFIPDKWPVHMLTRSCYPQLIEAGVRVYEYKPGFMHAKQAISDDSTAIVGTINLDYRSMYLNFECGVVFYNSSIIEDIKKDFISTIENSIEIKMEDTIITNPFKRVLLSIFKIFAPLA